GAPDRQPLAVARRAGVELPPGPDDVAVPVDQPWDDRAVARVDLLVGVRAGPAGLGFGADAGDPAVLDRDPGAVARRRARAVDQPTHPHQRLHPVCLLPVARSPWVR